MEVPADEQIRDAIAALQVSSPKLGQEKILATLKSENDWDLGPKRFKRVRKGRNVKPQAKNEESDTKAGAEEQAAKQESESSEASLPPIELPRNAHRAQVRYMDKSTRCFKIYGRGEYDYGVSPNMDQQLLIGICHDRLVKWGAPGPWSEGNRIEIARSSEMNTIWNYWWAAGRKVGLTKEDIARQIEAEYGVDPTPWLPVLSKKQLERRKAEFKEQSMAMKRAMLKQPGARQYIPVDARGEPVWDEKIHGEYTVLVVKINKGDGLTEYGRV